MPTAATRTSAHSAALPRPSSTTRPPFAQPAAMGVDSGLQTFASAQIAESQEEESALGARVGAADVERAGVAMMRGADLPGQ
jgi:hypothetical protein